MHNNLLDYETQEKIFIMFIIIIKSMGKLSPI